MYIFTKSYIIVNLWYQHLKLDKTYLPKGYLILEIPGIVNTDYVYYQNSPLFSTGLMLGTTLWIF